MTDRDFLRTSVFLGTFIILAQFFFAEQISVHHGFAWDGLNYGDWARDWPHEIIDEKVHTYHSQRVLPSLVVFGMLKISGSDLSVDHVVGEYQLSEDVITAFKIYNAVLLWLCFLIWPMIFGRLGVRRSELQALGMIIVFGSYFFLKEFFYVPVSTDQTAFFLGSLLLYLHLRGSTIGLIITTILGAFCWPITLYIGGSLLLFGNKERPQLRIGVPPSIGISSLISAVFVAGMIYVYWIHPLPPVFDGVEVMSSMVILSLVLSTAIILFGSYGLLRMNGLGSKQVPLGKLGMRLGAIAAGFIAIRFCHELLSNGIDPEIVGTTGDILLYNFREGLIRPLGNIVSHVVYMGPGILLALMLWWRVGKVAGEYGWGILGVLGLSVLLAITTESREWIMSFPFVAAFLVVALQPFKVSWLEVAVFAAIQIVCSKVCMTFNSGIMDSSSNPLEYPIQRYMMNHGPWMSETNYLIQGGIVLALAVLFAAYFWLKPANRPD